MTLAEVGQRSQRILQEIEKVIVGKSGVVRYVLAGLLADGHVLIEDIPGVGKTMLARSLAKAVNGVFRRIQCTPDLLPSDITGTMVFDQKQGEFRFKPGPIFGNIILADEINRATPKAQASLLECMEERQVTVDGITHLLPRPFFVIATENPIEYHGTYPLPEAELDRFLLKVNIGYPEHRDEVVILERQMERHPIETVEPVVEVEELLAMQQEVRKVYVEPSLKDYIVSLVEATRRHEQVLLGASPRGSLAILRMAQVWAALEGRDYVLPDDVKRVAIPCLVHRLILRPEARMREVSPERLLHGLVETVEVPTTLKPWTSGA